MEEVFSYLADFENTPAWNYAIVETLRTPPGRLESAPLIGGECIAERFHVMTVVVKIGFTAFSETGSDSYPNGQRDKDTECD
jgi:hypothetical protein